MTGSLYIGCRLFRMGTRLPALQTKWPRSTEEIPGGKNAQAPNTTESEVLLQECETIETRFINRVTIALNRPGGRMAHEPRGRRGKNFGSLRKHRRRWIHALKHALKIQNGPNRSNIGVLTPCVMAGCLRVPAKRGFPCLIHRAPK